MRTNLGSPKSARKRPNWSFTNAFIGYITRARDSRLVPKSVWTVFRFPRKLSNDWHEERFSLYLNPYPS